MTDSIGIEDQRLLDEIASEFENGWNPEDILRVKRLLDEVDDRLRNRLLELLLEIEIELICQSNRSPKIDAYEPLGPEAIVLVRNLFTLHRNASETIDPSIPSPKLGTSRTSKSRRIGPYKLLHQIGEGGMGSVWMAEQERPVRRRVAIKLIKDEVGSEEAIARFEAERQALAIMDHQNIAKVLDAGTEESGRPYFVMELVKGVPITKYCDQNKLDINERLELMVSICHAVQHAHQKGIIHRDLKPSNVLVSLYDGKPTPKIIDFGLAKALEHTTKLTDKTMFTEFGKVVGTLQYMSPEQAEMNALDVDTRTDVYSLGVLLYEILTGTTPLDQQTMKQNLLQLLVYIKENEPPRPSVRLSSSGDAITGISDQRRISPSRLKSVLKGELDWVVMKALEKDRTRRYETASRLGDDLSKFLAGEAVSALPPSKIYQLKKLIQRNKGWVAAGTTILLLLVIGFVGMSVLWVNARKSRDDARLQQKIADGERKKAFEAREKADEARAEVEVALLKAKQNEKEARFQQKIAEERQVTTEALLSFFQNDLLKLANPWELELNSQGSSQTDISLQQVVDQATRKFAPENYSDSAMEPVAYFEILKSLANIHEGIGNFDKAEELTQGAFEIAKSEFKPGDPVYIEAAVNRCFVFLLQGKQPEALNLCFDVFFMLKKEVDAASKPDATREQKFRAKEAVDSWVNATKNRIDYRYRTLPIWEPEVQELLKINPLRILTVRSSLNGFVDNLKELYGDQEHESIIYSYVTIGCFDFAFGRYAESRKSFEKLLDIANRMIVAGKMRRDSVGLMGCRQVLSLIYSKLKIKPETQRQLARENYEIMKASFSEFHPATIIATRFYGEVLFTQKRYNEAVPIMSERSRVHDKKFGKLKVDSLLAIRSLARVLRGSARYEEAFEILTKRLKLVTSAKETLDDEVIRTAYLSVYFHGQAALRKGLADMAVESFSLVLAMERDQHPNDWSTFDTQSLLGESQFANGDFQQAEKNLLESTEGLRKVRSDIPADESDTYKNAIERLIRFYEAKFDEAESSKWKKILAGI